MYAYIKGVLVASQPHSVIVETQGIGWQLFVPCHISSHLPPLGETVLLYTTFVVRELSHSLYGFLSSHERDLFETLLEISGIGPKLALNFIGHISVAELQKAIVHNDIRTLCKIPGIGKKTAERLLIELKDKVSHILPSDVVSHSHSTVIDPKAGLVRDAMSALINLGFNQNIAQKAIKKSMNEIAEHQTIELSFLITHALKNV